MVEAGRIENVYRLQIMNATEATQNFDISVGGLPGLVVVSDKDVTIESTQARWVAVRLQVPPDAAPPGSHNIHFVVAGQNGVGRVVEKSVFIVPR